MLPPILLLSIRRTQPSIPRATIVNNLEFGLNWVVTSSVDLYKSIWVAIRCEANALHHHKNVHRRGDHKNRASMLLVKVAQNLTISSQVSHRQWAETPLVGSEGESLRTAQMLTHSTAVRRIFVTREGRSRTDFPKKL